MRDYDLTADHALIEDSDHTGLFATVPLDDKENIAAPSCTEGGDEGLLNRCNSFFFALYSICFVLWRGSRHHFDMTVIA